MLDKFKQLKELRKMQGELEKETVTVEKDGVSVTVNGKMQVQELQLNPDLSLEKNAKLVKSCVNDAGSKLQKKIAGNLGM